MRPQKMKSGDNMNQITVYCTYQGQKYRVETREGIMIDELDSVLREKLDIPGGFLFRHCDGSPWCPGVSDGDEFEYIRRSALDGFPDRIGTLYGCPTANDVPGTVPACMLTAFEGFQHTDV